MTFDFVVFNLARLRSIGFTVLPQLVIMFMCFVGAVGSSAIHIVP